MQSYNRQRDLPRVYCLWQDELGDDLPSRVRLIPNLERQCRHERSRGLANHWAYDLARHKAMLAMLNEERRAVIAMWQRDHAL